MTEQTQAATQPEAANLSPDELRLRRMEQKPEAEPATETAESVAEAAEEQPEAGEGDDHEEADDKRDGEQPRKRRRSATYRELKAKLRELEDRLGERTRTEAPQGAKDDAPPKLDDFPNYDEFSRATARYEARQLLKEERERDTRARQEQAQTAAVNEVREHLETSEERARDRYDDYDDVVYDKGFQKHLGAVTRLSAGCDDPASVIYSLAKTPDKLREILSLSPVRAAAAIAKYEASLAVPPKRLTKAPSPPAKPAGRGGTQTPTNKLTNPDEIYSRFIK